VIAFHSEIYCLEATCYGVLFVCDAPVKHHLAPDKAYFSLCFDSFVESHRESVQQSLSQFKTGLVRLNKHND
jgi:hypothetical protein